MDKMKEALTVIAETRDSERLRQFLATGQDRTSSSSLSMLLRLTFRYDSWGDYCADQTRPSSRTQPAW